MFKQMRLGTKLLWGFGLLTLITLLLGLVTIVNLRTVEHNTTRLVSQNMPEWELAADIDKITRDMGYFMLGYSLSYERSWREQAWEAFKQLKDRVAAAQRLATDQELRQFAAQMNTVETALGQYEHTMRQAQTVADAILTNRQRVREAAVIFESSIRAYTDTQRSAMLTQIEAAFGAQQIEGATLDLTSSAELILRQQRIDAGDGILHSGRSVIEGLWQAEVTQAASGLAALAPMTTDLQVQLAGLIEVTRQTQNLALLNTAQEALSTCVQAVEAMIQARETQAVVARDNLAAYTTILKTTTAVAETSRQTALTEGRQTRGLVSRAMSILSLGALAGVLVAIGLGIAISRSITHPIRRIIAGLQDGADEVTAASSEISSASQSLAEGASQQAASLEETASSLEEMSSMTRHNAANAKQADQLMVEARNLITEADTSMAQLTRSMQAISQASEETSKIIKTIDEIAFQTNLLALNAAVEAARAGEAGAGFAVVADEVRNLALRAASAAKDTAGLIEGTVTKVHDGAKLVAHTNEAFQKVARRTKDAVGLVAEIAAASDEQSQGIQQINTAVSEMDQVTQQNAANAEESAAAAEELNAQSEQMRGMVQELVDMVGQKDATRGRPATDRAHSGRAVELLAPGKPRLMLSAA